MSFAALLVFTVLFLLKGILKEYMRIKCEIVTSTVRVIWEEFFFLSCAYFTISRAVKEVLQVNFQ